MDSHHDRRLLLITMAMANHISTAAHTAIAETGTGIETGPRGIDYRLVASEVPGGTMWIRTYQATKTTASSAMKKDVDAGTEIGITNLADGRAAGRRRDQGCMTESGTPEVEDRISTAGLPHDLSIRRPNGDTKGRSGSKTGTFAMQDTQAPIQVTMAHSA